MFPDILRLGAGLALALFHRPFADFVLEYEYALAGIFRSRGVRVPAPPSTETLRNVYFALGIVLALVAMGRIWGQLHPESVVAILMLK